MEASIYYIYNTDSGEVIYIGVTKIKLKNRLSGHLTPSNKTKWIQKAREQKIKLGIELIENIDIKDAEWYENYWIDQFRCWGFDLKNKRAKNLYKLPYSTNKM